MFYAQNYAGFENISIGGHFGFVFEEQGSHITIVTSSCLECSPSSLTREVCVFEVLWFEKRFSKIFVC